MYITGLKKLDLPIKSALLFLLSLLFTQIILPNSFISNTSYFNATTSSPYFQYGFSQFTQNKYSPFLFVISYYLLAPKSNTIIRQSVYFAIASIVSTAFFLINATELNAYLINTLLFFSIGSLVLENIFSRKLKIDTARYLLVFLSGILHGSLFSNSILDIDFPNKSSFALIFFYCAGILISLLSILCFLYVLIGRWMAGKPYYKKWIVNPLSIFIGLYVLVQIIQLLFSKN
jgi:HupE / UreJ protein